MAQTTRSTMTPPGSDVETYSFGSHHASEGEAFLAVRRRSLPPEPALLEGRVTVISHLGSASNKIGSEGDFYLDEMTNILYGPKADGVWPEEGVHVSGPILCKRTFIQLNPARVRRAPRLAETPKRSFRKLLIAFLRFHLPARSREMISLHLESRA